MASGQWSVEPVPATAFASSGHRPPTTDHYAMSAALQSNRGLAPKSEDYAGDDQVGALDLRAPIRALRRDAGRGRVAGVAAIGVDRRRHGFGAVRRDGVQSPGRHLD